MDVELFEFAIGQVMALSLTKSDYANNFKSYVVSFLHESDVYLTFDRYFKLSIKRHTHTKRERVHQAQGIMHCQPSLHCHHRRLCWMWRPIRCNWLICVSTYLSIKRPSHTNTSWYGPCRSQDPLPLEIHHNMINIRKQDMLITHEKADVIIANQVVYLAKSGYECIKVIWHYVMTQMYWYY